jgi:hypothetical protein
MLNPLADNPEKMKKFDTRNSVWPDGSTSDPSTVTGYNWGLKYFPNSGAERLAKDSRGNIVTERSLTPTPAPKAMATPTLMPSNMKNVNSAPINNPQVMGAETVRKQEKVPADFYDASQKYGDAMGVPKEVILANSRWEHRNNSNWNEGKYVDNVWWNDEKQTGEESYGPGQINMRWFGPEAVKLGRITTDHPLYITPEQAKDPWGAAEWMAKKFAAEAKRYTNKGLEPDWEAILQGYNSNEKDRGKNVNGLITSTDFVRAQ